MILQNSYTLVVLLREDVTGVFEHGIYKVRSKGSSFYTKSVTDNIIKFVKRK